MQEVNWKSGSLSDMSRVIIPASQIEEGKAVLKALGDNKHVNDAIMSNIEDADTIPEGYGIAIVPVKEADPKTKKRHDLGLIVVAIPDPSTVEAYKVDGKDVGREWAQEAVTARLVDKAVAAARPIGKPFLPTRRPFKGTSSAGIPITMENFLESQRGKFIKSFSKVAPKVLEVLKKAGMDMTIRDFQFVLSSSAVAESKFPKVEQKFWDGILDQMVDIAEKNELDSTTFVQWKKTRTAEAADITVSDDLLASIGEITI